MILYSGHRHALKSRDRGSRAVLDRVLVNTYSYNDNVIHTVTEEANLNTHTHIFTFTHSQTYTHTHSLTHSKAQKYFHLRTAISLVLIFEEKLGAEILSLPENIFHCVLTNLTHPISVKGSFVKGLLIYQRKRNNTGKRFVLVFARSTQTLMESTGDLPMKTAQIFFRNR